MPGDYRIEHARRAVLTVSGAPLSWSDFVRLVNRMVDAPDFEDGMPVLEDLRGLDTAPPADCMRAMVGLFQARADRLTGTRWVMVVGRGHTALFGVGRMAEILAEGSPVTFAVFEDLQAAEEWLAAPGAESAGTSQRSA